MLANGGWDLIQRLKGYVHNHSVRFQNPKVRTAAVGKACKRLQLCRVFYVDGDTKFQPKTSSREMIWTSPRYVFFVQSTHKNNVHKLYNSTYSMIQFPSHRLATLAFTWSQRCHGDCFDPRQMQWFDSVNVRSKYSSQLIIRYWLLRARRVFRVM